MTVEYAANYSQLTSDLAALTTLTAPSTAIVLTGTISGSGEIDVNPNDAGVFISGSPSAPVTDTAGMTISAGVSGVTVTGVTFVNSALSALGDNGLYIAGNTLTGSNSQIFVQNSNGPAILGNLLSGSVGGINVTDSASAWISGNTLTSTNGGISFTGPTTSATGATITGNTIALSGTVGFGILDSDAIGTVVNYNTITNASATGTAIELTGSLDSAAHNVIAGGANGIIGTHSAGSLTIAHNTVSSTVGTGIGVYDGQADTITGNSVSGANAVAGIEVTGLGTLDSASIGTNVNMNFINQGTAAASTSAYPASLFGFPNFSHASAVLLGNDASDVTLASNVVQQTAGGSFAILVAGGQHDTIGSYGGTMDGTLVGSPTGNGNVLDLGSHGYNAAVGFVQDAAANALAHDIVGGNLVIASGGYNGTALTNSNSQMWQFVNSGGTLTSGTIGTGTNVDWNDIYASTGGANGAPAIITDYNPTGAISSNFYQVTAPANLTWSGGSHTATIPWNQVPTTFGA